MILMLFGCGVYESKDSSRGSILGLEHNESDEMIDETMTIMVYMVGSDLEAATNDMLEMESSGVDLSKVNLLIYTGGSPKWHNEKLDIPSDVHAVFFLTENGFEKVKEFDEVSMGNAKALTRFLDYGYENYKSDTYGLIMWNHGNGPVMGFGSDIKHDKDTLTLVELESALQESPFGEDLKLEFIGFDACLMSSVELTCMLDDYSKYMVHLKKQNQVLAGIMSF